MSLQWMPAYIGVGSNLEDPVTQVARGCDALAQLPRTQLVVTSKYYRSAPLGPQDQPPFVNAVAALLTQLDPFELLASLKGLEKRLGRAQPIVRWGPRIIDFDVLIFGEQRIATDSLRVPHPGLAERAFVLRPLLDIAPDLQVPGLDKVRVLFARIEPNAVIEEMALVGSSAAGGLRQHRGVS